MHHDLLGAALAGVFSYLNVANAVWVLCYGVKDVLLLRILAVAAMCIIIPHYILVTQDFGAAWWNVLFITINVSWIICILLERRPPRLTEEQQRLHALTFHSCTPRQMLQILRLGMEEQAPVDTVILEQGKNVEDLLLIAEGPVVVCVDDRRVARLGDGDFVGEMSFLSGEPTTASAVTNGPVKLIRWNKADLQSLLASRIELESAFRNILGSNLVDKLSAATNRAPELTRSDRTRF